MDTRDRILLWRRRGKSVPWIAEKIGVARMTVYRHLHQLERDGELENGVRPYRPREKAS